MMASCTVDSALPNFTYLQSGDSFYRCHNDTWLQTEVYQDFVLPATVCRGCGPPGSELLSSTAHQHTPILAPLMIGARPPRYSKLTSTRSITSSTKRVGPKAPAWWETALAKDIHQTLRSREDSTGHIQFKSPQLYFRRELVDFLTAVSKDLCISTGTRHLSIRLMDLFMDGHNVMDYRLKLMALTCLFIAAKLEEPDDALPTIEMLQHTARINDFGNNITYSRQEFHTLELYILKYFKWCVSVPSAAHYIDYYQHVSITNKTIDQSDCSNSKGNDQSESNKTDGLEFSKMENQIREYCAYFLELSLKDESFLFYKPSEVAAGIVCVARICSGMSTVWNAQLEQATSYSLESLQPIASYILSCLSTMEMTVHH